MPATHGHTTTHLTIGDASSDDGGAVVTAKTDDHNTTDQFPSEIGPIGGTGGRE